MFKPTQSDYDDALMGLFNLRDHAMCDDEDYLTLNIVAGAWAANNHAAIEYGEFQSALQRANWLTHAQAI